LRSPLLKMAVVVTRVSLETAYASRPPQEKPATAILEVSSRP
jgi:hypothetical protein